MKVSSFCALLFVVGAALVFVTFSSPIDDGSWFPVSQNRKLSITYTDTPTFFNAISGLFATNCGERRTVIAIGRKLKENGRGIGSNYKGDMDWVTMNDYNPTKPMPDAKNYVKGGTIEHDQPVGPYMPKPMPPPPGDGDES